MVIFDLVNPPKKFEKSIAASTFLLLFKICKYEVLIWIKSDVTEFEIKRITNVVLVLACVSSPFL